jgi:hypothetical protein
MKQSSILKIGTAIATFALFAPINSFAQADSTNTVRLTGVPIVKLRNQERETPVTNNITNTTNQITQVVQPNTYQVANSSAGNPVAAASVSCGGGTLLGGGGTCNDNITAWSTVSQSYPSGNSWVVQCASENTNPRWVFATAYAVCSN